MTACLPQRSQAGPSLNGDEDLEVPRANIQIESGHPG